MSNIYTNPYNKRKGQQTAHLSERARLGLLCLLLLLMLGVLVYAAVETVQAVQNFQHQYTAVRKQDVSAIHPWMTISVVSHIYHVPENYLYTTLGLPDTPASRHMTIDTIAHHKKQTTTQVIHTLQQAIVSYRKEHHSATPTPTTTSTPAHSTKTHSPPQRRTRS